MLRGRRATVAVAAVARTSGLAALAALGIGLSAPAQEPIESAVEFDGAFGGRPGPAHAVPYGPLGEGLDFRIDYCPSCTETQLPGGSHGQLVGTKGLLQSLWRLDVKNGDAATFAVSEPNTTVAYIFARVTGNDQSDIYGALRSEVPGADLYVLNPYGVVFGPTAELDVLGSFYVSTADELRFPGDQKFEARLGGEVPTVAVAPSSFGFLIDDAPPATIAFEGTRGFSAADGGTLSAVAGRVEIGGGLGIEVPTLESTGGTIQLAAVPSGTDVPLDVASLDVDGLGDDAAVHLASNAIVAVEGSGPEGPARIVIRGGRFETLQPSGFATSATLRAQQTGPADSPAIDIAVDGTLSMDAALVESVTTNNAVSGDIRLAALRKPDVAAGVAGGSVELDDGTLVVGRIDRTLSAERGGPAIHVEANSVAVREGSKVQTHDVWVDPRTGAKPGYSSSKVGDIDVKAAEVEVSGEGSEISTVSNGRGDGATVRVEAGRLALSEGGKIATSRLQSRFSGGDLTDFGRIEVTAEELSAVNGGEIVSSTTSELDGAAVQIGTAEAPLARVALRGGGIGSITQASGKGGAVVVHAREIAVESSEASPDTGQISALTTRDDSGGGGDGPGGDLTIYAGSLDLVNGGQLRATTEGSGPGGKLEVHVEGTLRAEGRITTDDGEGRPSGIFARSELFPSQPGVPTTGPGGQLIVSARDVVLKGGAELSARAQSEGPAGDFDLTAETILVEGAPDAGAFSTISTRGGTTGAGGDLVVRTDALRVVNGGLVSASTAGTGRSGNLEIYAREIDLAGEKTGVFAQSVLGASGAGRAGNVILAPPEGERLTLRVRDGALLSVRSLYSAAGKIEISGARLVEVSNGGEINARVHDVALPEGVDPRDFASDIRIVDTDTLRMQGGTMTAETRGTGLGGSIDVRVRNVALSGSEITTRSTAEKGGNAGNIVIAASEDFEAANSAITTTAEDAGGGRISIQAGHLVHLLDSRLETTVQGEEAGEDAGDIDIPLRGDEAGEPLERAAAADGLIPLVPEFVVVNRSIIRANATATNAGNITITGENVLISSDSVIEATSDKGVNGEIQISSPDADIVSQITPLPSSFVDPSDRLLPPCAARTERTGSFVVQSREAIPPPPDAPLSPALAGSPGAAGAPPAMDSENCPVSEESS